MRELSLSGLGYRVVVEVELGFNFRWFDLRFVFFVIRLYNFIYLVVMYLWVELDKLGFKFKLFYF